nr:MAG TPA: hypothetical protein [Caudoviricetes sp.]
MAVVNILSIFLFPFFIRLHIGFYIDVNFVITNRRNYL